MRTAAILGLAATAHALVAPTTPHQRLAPTNAVADLLRDAKLDIPWLAEGEAPKENKVNTPDSAKRIFALPTAPKRDADGSCKCICARLEDDTAWDRERREQQAKLEAAKPERDPLHGPRDHAGT